MSKNIFDIISEYSVNEGLDSALLQDKEYMKIQNKISEQGKQFDKLDLTGEQRLIIDRLICSYTESGAFYGKIAYGKGFKDCAFLLKEMGLIKAS